MFFATYLKINPEGDYQMAAKKAHRIRTLPAVSDATALSSYAVRMPSFHPSGIYCITAGFTGLVAFHVCDEVNYRLHLLLMQSYAS